MYLGIYLQSCVIRYIVACKSTPANEKARCLMPVYQAVAYKNVHLHRNGV